MENVETYGLEKQYKEQQSDGGQGNEAAWGNFQKTRPPESQQHGKQTEADGKEQCGAKTFLQLQGSCYWQCNHCTEDQYADDLDRNRYSCCHKDGEDVIDAIDGDACKAGGFFIVGDIDQGMIQCNQGSNGEEGKHQDAEHVTVINGQYAAEEKGIGVGMQVTGTDDGDGCTCT